MIFISYRRADAGGYAGRLFDRLRQWFDADQLFYDLDGIDIGDVFPARLETAIGAARVVLVLIGPDWLAELGRRSSQTGVDFVRREVELALARQTVNNGSESNKQNDILIIPLLFADAAMPSASDFNAELRPMLSALSALNALKFGGTQAEWDAQFIVLRDRIAALPGMPSPRFRAPEGGSRAFHVGEHRLSNGFCDPEGWLTELRAQLTRSPGAVPTRVALCGMGGIGKTQLALKYSLDYADQYAGVWWFDAENETRLQLETQDFCQQSGVPQAPDELPTTAIRRWLEGQPGSWLVVFDNAPENAGHGAVLRAMLPQRGPHHLLITSRDPAWNGQAGMLELTVWTNAQSTDFLAQRRPAESREALLGLANELGGLPLALEQAACYLDRSQRSAMQYCQMLTDHTLADKLLRKDALPEVAGTPRSVAATLSIAFDRLSLPARQLLRLCAFAAPQPIPERLFGEGGDALRDEFAPLVAAMSNPLDADDLVGELIAYGLCSRVSIASLSATGNQSGTESATESAYESANESALKLHRLTQQVARASLVEPALDGPTFANLLTLACPPDPRLPAGWPRFAAIAGHIMQLDTYDGSSWLNQPQLRWLLDRVANYLQNGPALHAEAIRWFQRNVDINQREFGATHRNTLSSLNNLAVALQAGGQLRKALAVEEVLVVARREQLGELHLDTLASMGNLASTRRALREFNEACALEKRVLAGRQKLLGNYHPDTLTSMNNLAATLREQGGADNLARARRLQIKVLHARRLRQGANHPETLICINNLASTLREQGNLRSARVLQQYVLEVCRSELGPEHPDTLRCMNNLAGTLKDQGEAQLPAARALEEAVFDGRRRRLGEEHPATLRSGNNLALTRWRMKEQQPALELMRRVTAGYARQLGPQHPDTLDAAEALAAMQASLQMPGLLGNEVPNLLDMPDVTHSPNNDSPGV